MANLSQNKAKLFGAPPRATYLVGIFVASLILTTFYAVFGVLKGWDILRWEALPLLVAMTPGILVVFACLFLLCSSHRPSAQINNEKLTLENGGFLVGSSTRLHRRDIDKIKFTCDIFVSGGQVPTANYGCDIGLISGRNVPVNSELFMTGKGTLFVATLVQLVGKDKSELVIAIKGAERVAYEDPIFNAITNSVGHITLI